MRGDDAICGRLFSYIDLEDRVRSDHPLRPLREIANVALTALSSEFASLYSGVGRPSVPPEKMLRAMLLQAFYSVRSERQLMERIESTPAFAGAGSVVPLVYRHRHRGSGVGPFELLEEPRPAAGR
jgi:hypothetical protein